MSTNSQALAGLRVLVVDADPDRADAIAGMLSGAGAATATASALNQALDLLETADPGFDGVVLGERLSDGSGPVLARAIRTSPPLFDLRLVLMANGPPAEGIDVACAWPATAEALVAAITGPASTPAAVAVDDPILDLAELESIAGGMTVELLAMLRRFADQAPMLAAEAMAAAGDADTHAAQGRAHALKGAALSAGAMRLGRAAQSFEKAAAAADWATASAIDLAGEAQTLARAIRGLPEPSE